ncbi:hypothetical protein D9611_014643 [Ephemerocybe angulata]|uniref:RING-type domain-containing protein n=1 Tax=Ephemerocybe angulata TaxID=980116 RepID=A0A8H5CA45_9AGAR|nr:hypothetical protein D9611_014643 [Tulosesus angulatus]
MDNQSAPFDDFDTTYAQGVLDRITAILPHAQVNCELVLELVLQSLLAHGPEETIALVVQFLLDQPSLLVLSTEPVLPTGHATVATNTDAVDCQCCFTSLPLDQMVTCPTNHPFCNECVQQYASTQLGEHKTRIPCMYSGGAQCQLEFAPSTLRSCLPQDLLTLYERLTQQNALKEAQIEGLEECPFCDFACVMDIPLLEVSTFSCQDLDKCGLVSCRICRAKEHPGRPCDAVEKPRNGRLEVEEAMTRALMRNCPGCRFPFIKEDGCNKMICPNCSTVSCYICRQIIVDQNYYDHFGREPTMCYLFEDGFTVEEAHAQEVQDAYDKAIVQEQTLAQTHHRPVAVSEEAQRTPHPLPNASLEESEDLHVLLGFIQTIQVDGSIQDSDLYPGEPMDIDDEAEEDHTYRHAYTQGGDPGEWTDKTVPASLTRDSPAELLPGPTENLKTDKFNSPDAVQLHQNVVLARDKANKAKRRLKYAENKLKGVESDIQAKVQKELARKETAGQRTSKECRSTGTLKPMERVPIIPLTFFGAVENSLATRAHPPMLVPGGTPILPVKL